MFEMIEDRQNKGARVATAGPVSLYAVAWILGGALALGGVGSYAVMQSLDVDRANETNARLQSNLDAANAQLQQLSSKMDGYKHVKGAKPVVKIVRVPVPAENKATTQMASAATAQCAPKVQQAANEDPWYKMLLQQAPTPTAPPNGSASGVQSVSAATVPVRWKLTLPRW